MYGFVPLASGSKGNCLYFGTKNARLLIDAGLSAKATRERLAQIGVELESIDAILITHEHTDHIRGLNMLGVRMGIPVFANSGTAKGIYNALGALPPLKIFTTGEAFTFKGITIHPFSIQHDTLDPVAFLLEVDNLRVGVCTDLGFATSLVQHKLQNCDYLVLEANHKPEMVHACARPLIYKQRVLSRYGHLPNEETGALLSALYHRGLKHVHLAHLSEECNHPEVALSTVQNILAAKDQEVPLSIAPQYEVAKAILF
ncbi:MAG: MBL fold metallo-hydrolase [Parachlamydiales bacterium]